MMNSIKLTLVFIICFWAQAHSQVQWNFYSKWDSAAVVTIVEVHSDDAWLKYYPNANWIGKQVGMNVGCTQLWLDQNRKLWFVFAIEPTNIGYPYRSMHIMARIAEEALIYQAMRAIYKIPDIYSY